MRKTTLTLLLAFCFVLMLSANSKNPFINTKEATSIFLDKKGKKTLAKFQNFIEQEGIIETSLHKIWDKGLSINDESKENYCELTIVTRIAKAAATIHTDLATQYFEGLLLYGRYQNKVDDVALSTLLAAYKIITTKGRDEESQYIEKNDSTLLNESALTLAKLFDSKKPILNNWRKIYPQLLTNLSQSQLGPEDINTLLKVLFEEGKITGREYALSKKLVQANAHKLSFDLDSYSQQLQLFRTKQKEKSSFVCNLMSKKRGITFRQYFFKKYNTTRYNKLQIKALGELYTDFSNTIYHSEVQINIINQRTGLIDTVELTPMEQYNFAIKQLQKSVLSLESKYYFYKDHKKIDCIDVILAAYELGLLPGDVLEQVTQIEELWKPNVTTGEKLKGWAGKIGRMGAGYLPPPFNLIASTGLMVIQSLSNKTEEDPKKAFNLF